MTVSPDKGSIRAAPAAEGEIDLLEYWRIAWKRRLLIGLVCGTAVVSAMAWSLMLPKIYESTVTLLPPMDSTGNASGGMAAAAAALGGAGGSLSLPGMPTSTGDLFIAILKSRSLGEELVKQFDLLNRYHVETEEDALKVLEGGTKISTTKEKVIKITVEAEDPTLAADLANGYVARLDKMNRSLAITKAGQQRLYIEKRLAEARVDLVAAEQSLAEFQARNKAVSLDQQASAALRAAAEIQARISAVEVQLQVMQNFATTSNPDVVKLRLELEELRQQLYTLESGKGGKGMLPGDRLHPAFITMPSLGLDYARLLREFKVQETVYTMLASQYEQAQLAEAKDIPTVQVLDPAKPATHKSKPVIRQNMLVAGVVALFIGVLLALLLEFRSRGRIGQDPGSLVSGA